MTFEEERIASEKAAEIDARVKTKFEALGDKPSVEKLIEAVNAVLGEVYPEPETGELTYEMDEES